MNLDLENAFLRLTLLPAENAWLVQDARGGEARLTLPCLCCRSADGTLLAVARWQPDGGAPAQVDTPHGPALSLRLNGQSDAGSLPAALSFALPRDHPFLTWSFTLENRSAAPLWIERMDMCALQPPHGSLRLGAQAARDWAFFSNGWQSWSHSGVYLPGERFHFTRLGPIRAPAELDGRNPHPHRRGHFISSMFAVLGDRGERRGLLAGCLSQKQHFSTLSADLSGAQPRLTLWAHGDGAQLDAGEQFASDPACLAFIELDDPDPLAAFYQAAWREAQSDAPHARLLDRPPTGWCSWYHYSAEDLTGALTADDVRKNLAAMSAAARRAPLQVCQIDDGYEMKPGDWGDFTPGFAGGVAPLAAEIRAAGFTPGLWLAPFMLHGRSRLARQHPEWLLRGRFNRPVNSAFLWNAFGTALDPTHPEALAYAAEIVHMAVFAWGYSYLKLDFLYAAALPGRYYDPTRTRAQALRRALIALRQAAGEETFLLGCGCPLGPAIGLVDGMRVGADTSRRWYPSFRGFGFYIKGERSLPAAAQALHNPLTRAGMHRNLWLNDPDCLLLGRGSRLTLEETHTAAAVIAMSGGSLFVSDDLSGLPPERAFILEQLLPPVEQRLQVVDWFDAHTPQRLRLDLENASGKWRVLALINWKDYAQPMTLRLEDFHLPADPARYYVSRFWQRGDPQIALHDFSTGELRLWLNAHESALLSLRPAEEGRVQFLGSDLHFSQGLEVEEMEADEGRVALGLQRPGWARGWVMLALPAAPLAARVDGLPTRWESCGAGAYRFVVSISGQGWLEVFYPGGLAAGKGRGSGS
ncbi:MAG: alpha-galactosidase [Chloroflexi bacterium]|nr:alpha-galactosidase [Chloroflexota bacterium]